MAVSRITMGKNERWVQGISLFSLMVYTSLATMVMRKSRDVSPDELYFPASSVFFGEVLKIAVSIFLHDAYSRGQKDFLDEAEKGQNLGQRTSNSIISRMLINGKDIFQNGTWKMGLPALLYVAQNCLQLHSISLITTVEYQALSQLKIVAIGIFSILLLRKKLFTAHWLCMGGLLTGIVLMQVNKGIYNLSWPALSQEKFDISNYQITDLGQSIAKIMPDAPALAHLGGIASVVCGCFVGSYAGVYMEKAFKSDRQGLWSSNAQLSFFSVFPATVLMAKAMYSAQTWNVAQNFGFWAWITVVIRGLGGIIVALVLKHCDNIAKAFATSAAIVLSMVLTSIHMQMLPENEVMLGALIVVISSVLYARTDLRNRTRST